MPESVPQNVAPQTVPQSRPAKIQSVPQRNPADFAVLDDLEDVGELQDFAGQDDPDWRIERRYRRRKDGKLIMYWNYRSRKPSRKDGTRRIAYRKGGSRVI